MTRVSFYVLAGGDALLFVCRLAEKVYRSGDALFIHCRDEAQIAQLDERLWTWSKASFLPHERYDGMQDCAVLLGSAQPPARPREVLINLADSVPDFFSSFSRCVELVAGDEEQRNAARERYRFYRDRGYPLDKHDIKK